MAAYTALYDACVLYPAPVRDYNFLQTRCNEARYYPNKPRPTLADLNRYETEQFARIVAEARTRGRSLVP